MVKIADFTDLAYLLFPLNKTVFSLSTARAKLNKCYKFHWNENLCFVPEGCKYFTFFFSALRLQFLLRNFFFLLRRKTFRSLIQIYIFKFLCTNNFFPFSRLPARREKLLPIFSVNTIELLVTVESFCNRTIWRFNRNWTAGSAELTSNDATRENFSFNAELSWESENYFVREKIFLLREWEDTEEI